MKNTVLTDSNGLIYVRLVAAQGSLPHIDKLKTSHQPVKILIDISEQSDITSGSNQMSLKVLDIVPYYKMAINGGNKELNDNLEGIIGAATKTETTKVFETREDAVSWLLN